jgi:cobalt-zinc-cadmium efflux system membrane fusion protein
MKTKTIFLLIAIFPFFTNCNNVESGGDHDKDTMTSEVDHTEEVIFSEMQYRSLEMKVAAMPLRTMSNYIETNGQLTLPPQSQAAVSSVIGANIGSIEVIEGRKVSKGQPLAYLYHPDIIELQTDYVAELQNLKYIEREFERQKELFQGSVGSGKNYEKTKADYEATKHRIKAFEARLQLLQLSIAEVGSGQIFQKVPLRSPINGYVQSVEVKIGQYVEPRDVLFEIVHNDHIHAHFKVYENDLHMVRVGQNIHFVVESQPEIQRKATIISIGKVFQPNLKAVEIHAEIENEADDLLPGMYARGRIVIDQLKVNALPKEAVVMEGERYYVFKASENTIGLKKIWSFIPVEVSVGVKEDDWFEIKPHSPLPEDMQFAWNNAYYLLSELMKDEAGHDH